MALLLPGAGSVMLPPATVAVLTNVPLALALMVVFTLYVTEPPAGRLAASLRLPLPAASARSDARWRYRELQTGHSPWETAPRELADLLLELR